MGIFSGDGAERGALRDHRRELLRDGINDIQGSIRANDGKSSAALVVHGLLFAGVLSVTREVGPVYETAEGWQQVAVVALLSLALVAFVVSVVQLTRAVSPYEPDELGVRLSPHHPRVFFPSLEDLRQRARCDGTNELLKYLREVRAMSEANIDEDYAAELLKVADIRDVEARRARNGYRWLRVELLFVASYLVFVAILAIGQGS